MVLFVLLHNGLKCKQRQQTFLRGDSGGLQITMLIFCACVFEFILPPNIISWLLKAEWCAFSASVAN